MQADLVSWAEQLAPRVAELAAEGEAERRLPDEIVEALFAQDVFRALVPRGLGGQERALPDSCLKKNKLPGRDKFKALYPDIDWPIQLDYGEKLGLGSRKYRLEKI